MTHATMAELLELAKRFPQAFQMLPISEGRPGTQGTWGAYRFDETMTFWVNSAHPEALDYYKEQARREDEKKMSEALSVIEKRDVEMILAQNFKAVQSVLPKGADPARMMRTISTAITQLPALARCSQASLINCAINAAVLGLEVNTPLDLASIVPFGGEATLMLEYKGKVALAKRTGKVMDFYAKAVYEKDEFSYTYGLSRDLVHKPYMGTDKGALVYAYAVIKYLNGGFDFEVVDEVIANEAMEIAKKKYTYNGKLNEKKWEKTPWVSWPDSMWKKTATHRLSKMVDLGDDKFARAAASDDTGALETKEIIDAEFVELGGQELPPQEKKGDKPTDKHKEQKADEKKQTEGEKKGAEKPEQSKKTEPPKKQTDPTLKQKGAIVNLFPNLSEKEASNIKLIRKDFPDEFRKATVGKSEKQIFAMDSKAAKAIGRTINEMLDMQMAGGQE